MSLSELWFRKAWERYGTTTRPIKEPRVSIMTAKGVQLDDLARASLGESRQMQATPNRIGYAKQPDEHYRRFLMMRVRATLNHYTNNWSDPHSAAHSAKRSTVLNRMAEALGTERMQYEHDAHLHKRLCAIAAYWYEHNETPPPP